MTRLATLVAGLARGIQRTAVGSSAVARNVTQLATGIALHGLRLAVTGVVVGTTAFVAGGSTVGGNSVVEATAEATTEAWAARTAGARSSHARGRAVASDVAHLTTRIAAAASGASGNAQSGTVSLNVTKTLAVVALFGLGGTWVRALVALVTGLLAIVAEALGRGADLSVVANVAALVAGSTRERRHGCCRAGCGGGDDYN